MRGSLDAALPLQPEESLAPPVSRGVPWTPAAVASLFCGLDSAHGRLPPPCEGFGMVACVEATAVTGGATVIWQGRHYWRVWWGHHWTFRRRDTSEARAPT